MLRIPGSAASGRVHRAGRLATSLAMSAICVPLLSSTLQGQSASFQPIGFLPGATFSFATGVNAFGTVVVGRSGSDGSGSRAFRWANGAMINLGTLGPCSPTAGVGSMARGVSADGSVVVGTSSTAHIHCQDFVQERAFRWTPSSGMVDLGGLPFANPHYEAFAANTDGTVVVGYSRHFTESDPVSHIEAFRWVNGTMTGLGYLLDDASRSSTAFGVNADGTVVVGSSLSSTGTQAFRWSAGTMTGIGYLPGASQSQANGVSGEGTIVGTSGNQAFRWVAGTMTGLGFLPGGSSSDALGVSSDGNTVVGSSVVGSRSFAFRWTPADGMQSIEGLLAAAGVDITGWQLTIARAVSADGSAVVGEGINPNGGAQGWMVHFARGACDAASQLADFNGDGRGDLLFRRNDGTVFLYLMDGFQILSATPVGPIGLEWRLVGVADFNGDGRADLLMRRPDGTLAMYLMNGATIIAAQLIGVIGTEWNIVGVGDFNGDGRADFMARRTSDGALAVYLMNGFQFLAAQVIGAVGTEWKIQGIVDLDGDGRADFLMRRASDGVLAAYLMNGLQLIAGQIIGSVGTEWTVVGLGDFSGDGKGDFLARRADGAIAMYLMNGLQLTAAQVIGTVGTEWNLAGIGDLNGDGRSDMVFRRTNGTVSAYLMNGFHVQEAQVLGDIGVELNGCYGQPPAMLAQIAR